VRTKGDDRCFAKPVQQQAAKKNKRDGFKEWYHCCIDDEEWGNDPTPHSSSSLLVSSFDHYLGPPRLVATVSLSTGGDRTFQNKGSGGGGKVTHLITATQTATSNFTIPREEETRLLKPHGQLPLLLPQDSEGNGGFPPFHFLFFWCRWHFNNPP